MRRLSAVDLMLLATVLLWALNISVTRYVVTNGFQPLAYATIRYCAAIAALLGLHVVAGALVPDPRRDLRLVLLAARLIFLNQVVVRHLGSPDERVDGRARARDDARVRRRSSRRSSGSSGRPGVLGRRRRLVPRRRPDRGRRERRPHRRPARRPARRRDRGDVGRLLGRDRAADAPVLAVPDQRARARARLGPARAVEHPAARGADLRRLRLDDGPRASRSRSSGRSSSRTSCGSPRSAGSGRRGRRSSPTSSRSSPSLLRRAAPVGDA